MHENKNAKSETTAYDGQNKSLLFLLINMAEDGLNDTLLSFEQHQQNACYFIK